MPKKTPATGKKGKDKNKAKKEGKQEPKGDKESDVEKAKANAALQEFRFDVVNQSRSEDHVSLLRLGAANEVLSNQLYRAEKDMLDVIGHFKRKDAETEEKIMSLEEQLKRQAALARQERENLVAKYTLQINELEDRFQKRSKDFDSIQVELKKIEEFRAMKARMEQELSSIREGMRLADKKHIENLGRAETRFFLEKERIKKEAEERLGQLEDSAHVEAIVKLDESSRSVFKENVRLTEALNYCCKTVEDLTKLNASLAGKNASMLLEKDVDGQMIQKNAAQMKAYREEISELEVKLQAQGLLVSGFEQETRKTAEQALASSQAGLEDRRRLRRLLAAREEELARATRHAAAAAKERSELTAFFHAALHQVRQEILAGRRLHKKRAADAYRAGFRNALAGKQPYPAVCTFGETPHSTNSVYSDMEEDQKWTHVQSDQVDITDLTWEQKEKVIKLLFASINGHKTRKHSQTVSHVHVPVEKSQLDGTAARREAVSKMTIVTHMPTSSQPSNPNSLPDIHNTT